LKANNIPVVLLAISQGIPIDTVREGDGWTALHIAVAKNYFAMSAFLILNMHPVNMYDFTFVGDRLDCFLCVMVMVMEMEMEMEM
jgi:hypothetical protein